MIFFPTTFELFFVFALGLIVGSFLNVCISRWPEEQSVRSPRSRCPSCLKTVAWFDNIPVVSWILLKARCRYCQKKISLIYPFIELITGILFLSSYWILSKQIGTWPLSTVILVLISGWLLISCLIVVSVVDLKHLIIPDEISLNLMPLGPLVSMIFPELMTKNVTFSAIQLSQTVSVSQTWTEMAARENYWLIAFFNSLGGVLFGGLSLWLLSVFGRIAFKKEAMGFGDVKLLAMLGGFLGFEGTVFTLILASFLGSFFGILFWIVTRRRHIPFGPWLMLAGVIVFFYKWPAIFSIFSINHSLFSYN